MLILNVLSWIKSKNMPAVLAIEPGFLKCAFHTFFHNRLSKKKFIKKSTILPTIMSSFFHTNKSLPIEMLIKNVMGYVFIT